MIPHRLTGVVWLVLVLAGRAVDGQAATLPRSADQAIDHTGDMRPYWTGRLEQDTTWRDTVYVGGDVTIAAAATLTLAPNTQVLFLPYHDATRGGLDSTRAELIIEGRLAAQAGGIVFRSADAGSLGAEWHGLVVEQGGRADVSNATIRDGLRCVYAKRGGRVTMDHVAFANCGKPTDEQQNFTDPPDVLPQRTEDRRGRRIAKKLGSGVLGGSVSGFVLGRFLAYSFRGEVEGIVAYKAFILGMSVGYPVGVGLGTSVVDRHDYRSLVFALAGSFLGTGIGLLLFDRDQSLYYSVPPITATLASELFRKPLESGRFSVSSVSLVPDVRGNWSAVATLRF